VTARRLVKHDHAKQDLIELFAYFQQRSEKAARQFLAEVQRAFELILSMPGIGARWESRHAKINGLRFTTVSPRFRDYLIFYRETDGGILIVSVLHGARDYQAMIDAIGEDDEHDSMSE
jgi:plasmid stabilization system protein ParE